jgi:glutaredoxin 3
MNAPSMKPVTIYTTAWCPYCHRAKALLNNKGVAFDEIDVSMDARRRDEMEQKSGRHTVPQIWIGDTHVGGCDDLHALERAGQLNTLLDN